MSPRVFIRAAYQLCVPLRFPVVGSSDPWKATAPSPKASIVWLDCVHEFRRYLWGGLMVGGSTLGGGTGGGLYGNCCGTVDGNLRCAHPCG